MSLTAHPSRVAVDASAMLVYVGTPFVAVSWSIVGNGTVTALSASTDAAGTAAAIFTPATAGDVVSITVTAGA